MRNASTVPEAVGVIIADMSGSRVIVQLKDETHPIVECRSRFSLFGGGVVRGETALDALFREIREEIVPVFVQNLICKHAKPAGRLRLPGTQFQGVYDLDVFESRLHDNLFTLAARAMIVPRNVLEGAAVVLERNALATLCGDTSRFVGSHNIPLRAFLEKKQ